MIDFNSETWASLVDVLKKRREAYVNKLISTEQGGDKLRGRIAEIDDLLGLQKENKPPQQPSVSYF